MANLLEQAQATLMSSMLTHAGTAVTYRRGGVSVVLDAVKGKSDIEIAGTDGGQTLVQSIDWIVKPEDLVLDGSQVTPERGDIVELTAGGKVVQHSVLSIPGEPGWRYTDPYRKGLRIHTKVVSEAPA